MPMHALSFLRALLPQRIGLGIGLLALSLVVVGCDSNGGLDDDLTVAELANSRSELSTLASTLDQADLVEDLNDADSSFTVFAPTNDAYEALDTDALTGDSDLVEEVTGYHIVPGQTLTTDDLEDGQTLETADGDSITVRVDDSTIRVNSDTVSTANLNATNGMIHTIDGVLLETVDAVDRTHVVPRFQLLRTLIEDADLEDTLRGLGPDEEEGITVFAPTNDAVLAAFDENDNDEIDDGEIPSNIDEILRYHVLDDVYLAEDVPTSATDISTLDGATVTLQRSDDEVTVNDTAVSEPDMIVENGVLHGIESVLTPPSN